MRVLLTAVVVSLVPGLGLADGIFTRDLGAGGTSAQCMTRAERALQAYAQSVGMSPTEVTMGSWSAQAFDLPPGAVDVQIACPYRDNVSEVVLLFAHSQGSDSEREAVVMAIASYWENDASPGATK